MTRREAFQATAALAAPLPRVEKGNLYTRLGVRPFINLTATYTINGGTLTLPEVKQAMDEASRYSVNLDELMDKVGERIASLLGTEAAMVASGCAAALCHATAGCITGGDPEKLQQLPDLTGLKNEIVIPRQSRNQYDHAMRMVGARMVMIETAEEFHAALNDRTALIAVLGVGEHQGKVRLEEIASAAHRRGIPVLVDAAAELPLKPNPYLTRGADLVAYSGGKIIRGPQCAGLLLGRKDLIRAAWIASSPHHGFGRPMKVGKEEILGMLAAVEAWANQRDIQAEYRTWENWLNLIAERMTQVPGVQTRLLPPAGASPFPVLSVSWEAAQMPITAGEIGRQLLEGEPRIMSHAEGDGHSFIIRPAAMESGQPALVGSRLAALFTQARGLRPQTAEAAPPAADISGEWLVTLRFVASEAEHRLSLAADGNRLSGTHHTRRLQGPVRGSVDGARVQFTSSAPFEGLRLNYAFRGTISGSGMAGEVDLGEWGQARWTARRA